MLEMKDILSGFHKYCATRYSEFKSDLNSHMKKYCELRGPSNILADHWSKFIEYSKYLYVQVLK